jgi:protease-4
VVFLMRQMPDKVDPSGRVLILNPEGLVQDQEVYPSEFVFPFAMPEEDQIQTRDLIRLIRSAAADETLAGVLVDFSNTAFAGPSTLLQISAELAALRESGKPVVAYSDALSTGSYLLAAQSEEIFVHPSGAVAISGLGGYRDYTRELSEKLKITIHNYSQGDYKSAVESLTRNDMSEPDREQRKALYDPLWRTLKEQMAAARGIEPGVFQTIADEHTIPLLTQAGYDNLRVAQEAGLIDGTKTHAELRSYMIERFGRDQGEDQSRETYPHITWQAYQAQLAPEPKTTSDAVAVVFVQGAIQEGEMAPGVAGAEDIAPLLRRAHENANTRAIVLRVNSPGGSITGSDYIRDEFAAAAEKGIPVVVSMGDVAASGGVWVSTPADRIFAEPTTITGSIGVAVAFPTLENLFDYVGVHFDGVTTSEHAGWGINRPVNEKLDALFARWASAAYERFVQTVADSRGRDPDYIRSIAGGRVWLAPAALELGLIDELGTMEDAIAHAAEAAGLADYRVDYVVKPISPAFALLRQFDLRIGIDQRLGSFAQQVMRSFQTLEGLSQPRATVMCTLCIFDMP